MNEQVEEIFMNMEIGFEKQIEHFKGELNNVRAGRANPHVLDKIMVDYYGAPTPIVHIANISVQDARVLVIAPWDTSLVKAISKEIMASDIGITPSDDGRVIRLAFPQLTEERRKELVKQTRKLLEDSKVICRNVRRDAMEEIKKLKKDSVITEDEQASYEKDIQKKLDQATDELDKLMQAKEVEIMQV